MDAKGGTGTQLVAARAAAALAGAEGRKRDVDDDERAVVQRLRAHARLARAEDGRADVGKAVRHGCGAVRTRVGGEVERGRAQLSGAPSVGAEAAVVEDLDARALCGVRGVLEASKRAGGRAYHCF